MSTVADPHRSPEISPRSASALNLIGGNWVEGRGDTSRVICNPADAAEMLAPVREAAPQQVDEACAAAARAFPGWRATPAPDRARVLFKFRDLLERNASDLAHGIVRENGKLLAEAHGSLRRGIDVVEFACGIPSQLIPHRPRGCFLGPTIFDDVTPEMFVGREEIFGPVVSVMRAPDLDSAITLTNRSRYGNTVSLFTQSGAAARTFRERIQVGMLGINLGVPAPMAFFPFGGWKNSLYGDLYAQGTDAVAFYTRVKVISERWFGSEGPQDGCV